MAYGHINEVCAPRRKRWRSLTIAMPSLQILTSVKYSYMLFGLGCGLPLKSSPRNKNGKKTRVARRNPLCYSLSFMSPLSVGQYSSESRKSAACIVLMPW